jgi:serine/threonine-protein phosphatase 2A regulatory subunit B'
VEGLAQNVLKLYMDYDMNLFDQCSQAFLKEEEKKKEQKAEGEKLWALLPDDGK